MSKQKTNVLKFVDDKYFAAEDLDNGDGTYGELLVTITHVSKGEVYNSQKQREEESTVINFKECKPLVAKSKTKLRSWGALLGSIYAEDWTGKQAILYVERVKAFGGYVDAIRWKAAPGTNAKPKRVISAEKWPEALAAVVAGQTTAAKVREQYNLTPEQDAALPK
jgi:hypothetical protein